MKPLLFLPFSIFIGPEKCKEVIFSKIVIFQPKVSFYAHFGLYKNRKKAKIQKVAPFHFFNYPKEQYYQFLDQSDNFSGTSSDFTAKSGGHVRSEKRAKKPFFGQKKC